MVAKIWFNLRACAPAPSIKDIQYASVMQATICHVTLMTKKINKKIMKVQKRNLLAEGNVEVL